MVGIIVPTKNNTKEFFDCIQSIKLNTKLSHRLYVADTGSTESIKKRSKNMLDKLYDGDFKFIEYDYYNFPKINNDVVKNHLNDDIDILVFCNNDITIKVDGLIDRMAFAITRNPDLIGTCGCRLVYPNDIIQHDGQVIKIPRKFVNEQLEMGHVNLGLPASSIKRSQPNTVDGNTFALCATKRDLFEKIGMLSEKYIECFEDVEYNLECRMLGLKNVILESDYWAYHHESLSRGKTEEAMRKLHLDYQVSIAFLKENYERLVCI